MADYLQQTTRFLRHLFERGTPAAGATDAGYPTLATGAETLLALEARIAEALWHPNAVDRTARNDFGAALRAHPALTAAQTAAAAQGAALCGARTAAFLPLGALDALHGALALAAKRWLPLVFHQVIQDRAHGGSDLELGHSGLSHLTDAGAAIYVPRNAQSAVDWCLVARQAAERSLTPALIALDGPSLSWALARAQLPSQALLRDFLGAPDELIATPTPAQELLFGAERRRVPRFFDADRPTAHAVRLRNVDLDAALDSRQRFVQSHQAPCIAAAKAALSSATGRALEGIHRYADGTRSKPEVWAIALGAAAELVAAVADTLAREEQLGIGVLALEQLAPLPLEQLRAALPERARIVALERGPHTGSDASLAARLRAALGGPHGWSVARYGPAADVPSARDVAELLRRATRGTLGDALVLGARSGGTSQHPKRTAWLDRVAREYPADGQELAAERPLSRAPSAHAVSVHALRDDLPSSPAQALSELLGTPPPAFRSRVRSPEADLWIAECSLGDAALPPSDDTPIDVAVLVSLGLPEPWNPLLAVRQGGCVLLRVPPDAFNGDAEHAAGWASLPARLRQTVFERRLRVYTSSAELGGLLQMARELLEETTTQARALNVASLPAVERTPAPLPRFVRDYAGGARSYDSLPRFYGEVIAPQRAGEFQQRQLDPHLALAALPPATAAFHTTLAAGQRLPTIDWAACTGCLKCALACPDAAIVSTALGVPTWLDAALAETASPEPSATERQLQRATKQLGARVEGQLAAGETTVVAPEVWDAGFEWLLGKLKPDAADQGELRSAFARARDVLNEVHPLVTQPLFREPHAASKGSGALLALAVDPRACQGCGACENACPERAIAIEPASDSSLGHAQARFSRWERLPDTPGASIAEAAAPERLGPMAASSLSRHCQLAMSAGDAAEPGSGARLATRLVAAVTELHSQHLWQRALREVNAQLDALRGELRQRIARSVPVDDLTQLEAALSAVPDRPANLSALADRLTELGERPSLDAQLAFQTVHAARELANFEQELSHGRHGTGRSRYALVLAGDRLQAWATRYPRNPFVVPVVSSGASDFADLGLALCEGLLAQHLGDVQRVRAAALLAKPSSDWKGQLGAIRALLPHELDPAERLSAPPLLILVSGELLDADGLGGLGRLLASDLPVRVVLLDERQLPLGGVDPTAFALAQRRCFVLSTSIAHPDHLFQGVSAALEYPGPAFIHIHAPSPRRHGFAPDQLLERARAAVDSRVHPLLAYDPAGEGAFGTRLRLDGNRAVEQAWVPRGDEAPEGPLEFALTEGRFAGAFEAADAHPSAAWLDWLAKSPSERRAVAPRVESESGARLARPELARTLEERAHNWQVLRELAGHANPFSARIRAEVERELAASHAVELERLRAEQAARLAAVEREQAVLQAQRLRQRLLDLTGYSRSPSREEDAG